MYCFLFLQTVKNLASGMSMVQGMLKVLMDNIVPKEPVAVGESESDTDKKPKFEIKPLDRLEEIEQLEKNLADEEFKNQFYAHFTKRMGTDLGSGTGEAKAYDLVDEMFTRNFFLSFSWTGSSSSSPTGSKVALQKFTRTVDTFFQIINNCDKKFSFAGTKKFLQNIMSKAKTRAALPLKANRKRSAPKNRKSGLVYNLKSKTGHAEIRPEEGEDSGKTPKRSKEQAENDIQSDLTNHNNSLNIGDDNELLL